MDKNPTTSLFILLEANSLESLLNPLIEILLNRDLKKLIILNLIPLIEIKNKGIRFNYNNNLIYFYNINKT